MHGTDIASERSDPLHEADDLYAARLDSLDKERANMKRELRNLFMKKGSN